jgi:uncharacterized protein (DUF58 family)
MALTDVEKGAIALKLLTRESQREGIRLQPSRIRRNIGRLAKETDIPADQLREFGRELAAVLLDECFREPTPDEVSDQQRRRDKPSRRTRISE